MRLVNRPLALLLAIVLGGLGVGVIVEVIALAAGHAPLVVDWTAGYRWAVRNHWNGNTMTTGAIVVGALGAVLLLLEIKPRRSRTMALHSGDKAVEVSMTKRTVAASLRRAVVEVDGVNNARVSVGARTVSIKAVAISTEAEQAQALRPNVIQAANDRLTELQLVRSLRVRGRVRARKA